MDPLDEIVKLPEVLFERQPEGNRPDRHFLELWSRVFEKYNIVADNTNLDRACCGLRSFYEYKITRTYGEDFSWNGCFENGFKERRGGFDDLRELLAHMVENGIVPLLLSLDDNDEVLIKVIDDDRTKKKPFKTLDDLRDDKSILKEILQTRFSLQGKLAVPLKTLCEDYRLIRSIDLFGQTSETVGKILKPPPNDHIQRNFQSKVTEKLISKNSYGINIISGEPGTGKSTTLDTVAWFRDPKCFVIKCDLEDCADDLRKDDGEIFEDPVGYFFRKSQGERRIDSILQAVYEAQKQNRQICVMLDSFEHVLYEFSEKITDMLAKIKPVVFITVDPRNEFLIRKKFIHSVQTFYLKDLNKKDVRFYLKTNGVFGTKYIDFIPGKYLSNPLHLSMVKDICKDDIESENKDVQIVDIYNDFIRWYSVRNGKDVNLWTEAALSYIFPQKNIGTNINFREEFPHRTIAEYLVAKWCFDPKNFSESKEYLSIIFRTYRYSQVYKFLYEIVHRDKSNNNQWNISSLCWGIGCCFHACCDDLKRKLYDLEEMVIKLGVDGFKEDALNCPYFDLNEFEFGKGDRFLHTACSYQNEKLVKILLESGSDPNDRNDVGRSPLHHSCLNDNLTIITSLLDFGADPNLFDQNGDTPLHTACKESKNAEVVEVLLHHKADPNLRSSNDSSYSSLHAAVSSKRNTDIIKKLLDYEASPNVFDSLGLSSLHLACRENSVEPIKLLIDHGADPNIENERNWTCLHEACNYNNVDVVIFLLPHVKDPSALDEGGWSPLLIACHHRNEIMLTSLLHDDRVDVDVQRSDGCTALHYACSARLVSFVEKLLEAGCDVNLRMNSGHTPLHSACRPGHKEIVEMLLKAGADPTLKIETGLGCVDLLCGVGSSSIAEMLLKYASEVQTEETSDDVNK